MDISIDRLIENSYVISINDSILNRFNRIFTQAGFNKLPKCIQGFKFNQEQFKQDKYLKSLYSSSSANSAKYGALGCGMSHAALIKHAQLADLDFVCIFEDDAYPCDGILKELQTYLVGIPDDCDILKLGWSRIHNGKIELNSKFNAEPRSWGTFAYIVFKRYYKEYFKHFEKSYVSDYIVMNNKNVKIYHTQKKLFSYYNEPTDKTISSHGKICQTNNFSLSYLKGRIIDPKDELTDALEKIGNFAYRPNGGNTGDLVIAFAELQLFKRLNLSFTQIQQNNKQALIDRPFNLVYGGGGGWVNIYNYHNLVSTYFTNPNMKKCIILPSTFYKCDDVVKTFDERFTVFCRDLTSYEYCKSFNTKAQIFLHTDLVFSADFSHFNLSNLHDITMLGSTSIIKAMHEYRQKNKTQNGCFIRTDREKTVDPTSLKIPNFDVSNLKNKYGESLSKNEIEDCTKMFLYLIDKYQTIYTNRLHVAICAYKLGKQIQCYDNSYGKVFNVLKYSIPDYKQLHFVK